MKILFIGGTGTISSACAELAIKRGHELYLLNRSISKKYPVPASAAVIRADIHAREDSVEKLLAGQRFDAVVDFIAFTVEDIERDLRLFRHRTDHFVFISSAAAYQKPLRTPFITERTPLENPFWDYARNKVACEERLMRAYRNEEFPVTIIRPSLTYGHATIPLAVGSSLHPWTVIDRMKRRQKVIVHGDGTSLWTITWNADFAKGLIGLLGNKPAIGEAFHITSDEVLCWDRIYGEVYQALGLEPNIIHIASDLIAAYHPPSQGSLVGDKANSVLFDNSKIKRFVPDFVCEVSWAEGVRRSLVWFDAHPEFQTLDHALNELWDRLIASYMQSFPQ